MAAGPANAIEVEHLTKKFGELVAVNDINFNVAHREIFGLLGPNGAGKTTLIRMMTTLTPPTSGTARIAGHDIRTDADGVRFAMGVIPQALTSDPELTATENILIHAKLYGVARADRDQLIHDLLESVDLLKFKDALVRTFSGGMRRRLEIARGLVHSPKILFLDEPTTGLDPVSRTNVWQLIRRLCDRSEMTILVTTHYMDEAEYCNRLALIYKGKLIALGLPSVLKSELHAKLLQLETSDLLATMRLVQAEPGVLDVAVFGAGLHVSVEDVAACTERIRRVLQRENIAIRRLESILPSMEDVFVALIEAEDQKNP
jgi:ABC-2 type transport system ATP-binding protein